MKEGGSWGWGRGGCRGESVKFNYVHPPTPIPKVSFCANTWVRVFKDGRRRSKKHPSLLSGQQGFWQVKCTSLPTPSHLDHKATLSLNLQPHTLSLLCRGLQPQRSSLGLPQGHYCSGAVPTQIKKC